MTDDNVFYIIQDDARQAAESGICVLCKAPFSEANVQTAAGWAETKISGLCEHCFDAVCVAEAQEEEEIEEFLDAMDDDEAAF